MVTTWDRQDPPGCCDDYRGRLRATRVALMAKGLG